MAEETKKTTAQTAKRGRGRPSTYSAEIVNAICQEIAQGKSLKKICGRKDRPSRETVFQWISKHKEFADKYARARELQAEFWAHEILEIADTPLEGERSEEGMTKDGPFSKTIREDMLGHRRLQVDARKWLMSKLAPKKYGDRMAHEIGDPEGKPLVPTIIVTGRPELSPPSQAVGGIRDRSD